MTVAALLLYLGGLAVVFGVRTWLHYRRTGSSGFHGISGKPGSLPWIAGMLFVLALVLGVAAPALAFAAIVAVPVGPAVTIASAVGVVVAVVGFAGVLAAQTGMGASWRIGVDEGECTHLVTGGAFGLARNPIFTAMIASQVGLTLMVPNVVSLAALGCLVTAVQLQVRLIEEPYLRRVHGLAYTEYASRTGRFFPGLGRWPAPARRSAVRQSSPDS